MRAIISDIHGNLEALEKVLADIKSKGADEIICLGDLIGYGPDPASCVDFAREWKIVLRGNHDEAVVNEAYGFNPVAREAIEWTRSQLRPGLFSSGAKKRRWDFLRNLPPMHQEDSFVLVHGSPRDPTMEYILRADTEDLLGEVPAKIRDIFSRFPKVCFVGHTHDPGIITEDSKFISPREMEGSQFSLTEGAKYVVNVGSVGQPRDGDNRACYVTFDGKVIAYHRVPYDFEATKRKILAVPPLDPRIGERLGYGR